jgi:hypothetical protein
VASNEQKADFTQEPRLWAALEQALEVVERDVRATGIIGTPRLIVPDWDPQGLAWVEFRGICQGNGLWPVDGEHENALGAVADAAQEVIMEAIWAPWPVCPAHDRGLHLDVALGEIIWRCTAADAHAVAPVGRMPSR